MCSKTAYGARKIGKALRAMTKKGKNMRAYKCDLCDFYHLTSEVRFNPVYNLETNGIKRTFTKN